ncbi:unnamed protein product [Notodromas monacha]|uniref:Chitinase n=1 Tax=Notodromas monacha TaxID=399045 RepID=A0A7R9BCZ2_9CRUS|nr:unnamed protein product [Notodromas monacha]CAG0913024.1 unnamed protein product [Notodromas monacha]
MKLLLLLLVALATVVVAMPPRKLRAGVPEKPYRYGQPKEGRKLVCYYGSWAVYRPGPGKYDIEDIDPFLCTHLVFGFAALDNTTWQITAFDPWNDLDDNGGKGAYRRFNALRQINPALTTIIAIGGWNEGSEKYSDMASIPERRATFVQSCVQFVQLHGFDGLDMDWEYPSYRGGAEEDKIHFAALLRELKVAFSAAGLLLTSAVSPSRVTIDDAYDIQALIETLDIINVMAYDYHGAWDTYVHHNAPVHGHALDSGNNTYFNVEFTINYWVELMGVHSDRLTMGLPLYSRGFTLDDPALNQIYDNATEAGIAGPYTRQVGVLGYNELCEIHRDQGEAFQTHWLDDLKAKYVIFERDGIRNQWFSYDDIDALAEKMALIDALPIGGAMVWSVETDDFQNTCGEGKNPLLNYILRSLNGFVPTPDPDRTTVSPPSSTTKPSVTIPGDDVCAQAGINPTGPCSGNYVICAPNGAEWIVTQGSCPPGLVINPEILNCDYPDHVAGCQKKKH